MLRRAVILMLQKERVLVQRPVQQPDHIDCKWRFYWTRKPHSIVYCKMLSRIRRDRDIVDCRSLSSNSITLIASGVFTELGKLTRLYDTLRYHLTEVN
jgi:hypothetical protein